MNSVFLALLKAAGQALVFPGQGQRLSCHSFRILLLAPAASLQAGLSEGAVADGHSSHLGGMFWVGHLGFESLGPKRGEFWSASGGTSFTVGEESSSWRGSSGQSGVCVLVSLSSRDVWFVGIRGGCVREEVAQESTAVRLKYYPVAFLVCGQFLSFLRH